jgi:hypothetical protein
MNRRTEMARTLGKCAALIAGALTCFAGTAEAGLMAPGTGCFHAYGTPANMVYHLNSWSGNTDLGAKILMVCPLAVDHTIGTNADFTIVVDDQNPSDGFNCSGHVMDSNGNSINSVVGLTTSAGALGLRTLSGSVPAAASTNNNYVVLCEVPPVGNSLSSIRTLKVN